MLPKRGLDTETHLISADQVIPRFVCATVFDDTNGEWLASNADNPVESLIELLKDFSVSLVIQNAAFDLTVLMRYALDVENGLQIGNKAAAKELRFAIWERMEANLDAELAGQPQLIDDPMILEKLYTLSTTGNLESLKGKTSLGYLTKKYLGIDIMASKQGPDIWRLKFNELDGIPSAQWPKEAADYAMDDAVYAKGVCEAQYANITPEGFGSANSQSLQIYAATVLRLSSSHGMLIDRQQVWRLTDEVKAQVTRERLDILYQTGVCRENGSVNMAVLRAEIEKVCAQHGIEPRRTEKTQEVSTAAEDLEDLRPYSKVIDTFQHRQEYQKLLTAFLPNLDQPVVYTNYDELKETGRTSSYGGSEQKKSPYPAINIQQLPRLPGVRESFCARPGYVLCSTDYTALELCSVGQACKEMFGHSIHADRINAGFDLHTYLGSSLAAVLEPDLVEGHQTGSEDAYRAFMRARKGKIDVPDPYLDFLVDEYPKLKGDNPGLIKKRAGHYRTLAKPLGLGFPGMIGPATMCSTAKTTYGVDMTLDQGKEFRELWRATYPESQEMRRWADQQQQPDGTYTYETPFLRRFRAGATYNAAANGRFMQSPSADGAKLAGAWLARAMYGGLRDHPYRILEGCRMLAFIHDEFITEIPFDHLTTERALVIAHIQCQAMACVMNQITFTIDATDFPDPDAKPSVEPALMLSWSKAAGDPIWTDCPQRDVSSLIGIPEFEKILKVSKNGTRKLVPWEHRS